MHGPFMDMNGIPMLQGGATQLLAGDGQWEGPGGQTVYLDSVQGDTIVFHAHATFNGVAAFEPLELGRRLSCNRRKSVAVAKKSRSASCGFFNPMRRLLLAGA